MKLKYIIYLLLVVGFAYLVVNRISANKKIAESGGGPGGGRGGAGGGKGGGAPAMRVSGVVLQPQEFANTLAVNGSIEANEQVQIRSEVSGLVRNISFKEGSNVTKGQVLVKIDDTELRAQLSQAQTRQSLAAENARRAGLLLEKEAISREENDVARADLQSAQAQTQLVRAQLAKTTIRAPFSGRIGLRAISEGAYISPATVIANLVSTDPVKITFSVPEKYASQVKLNTELTFMVAGSKKEYPAKVYAIEPGIETTTRTLQLRARAANPNGELLPGSFANIQLPLNVIPDALLVPTEAVIPVQNGKKVFVTQNGKAKEALVETATRTERDVLVTSGLRAGDTVLTTGVMTLKDGAPVKVKVTNKQNEG
ncbi:MexH family multidrug efflux RND transporter periplasmic adaptor subunit [Adhaeribacter aerolatus]|uniref:MexH family multidrug efflux RND transporter periplasmic adaptor subunit n=1 Tax=Adhaeribacter aerolatus TaxID=670289 RepID=A0A512AU20_9BACT|nr:efflux RND transporter periplasmic adaptor subunit [Adhaeribacter aerolatus]GEO03170.1 MexH family multidrug efflux RND transporter periplasmic adaptor subunit [Adhaeribacter aerolatus]